MQVEGGISLFNSKCKRCSTVDNGAMNFIPTLVIRFRITNSCTSWRGIFEGLSQDGGRGAFFLKTSAPLSLIKTFRMNLISAGSISLDSIFEGLFLISRTIW
jgi:hypothetical protein